MPQTPPQIILLTGDGFLQKEFRKKHSEALGITGIDDAILPLDVSETAPTRLAENLLTRPLFQLGNRLFILTGLLKNKEFGEHPESLIKALENLDPECFVLITETAIDKRLKTTKLLTTVAKTIDLTQPTGADLAHWAEAKAKEFSIIFEPPAWKAFLATCGNNAAGVQSELEKVKLYANGLPITLAMIEACCRDWAEVSIFTCTDAIGVKNRAKALEVLHKTVETKQDAIGFVGLLASQIRRLLKAKSLQSTFGDHWRSHLKEPPFLVNKLADQVKHFSEEQLLSFYNILVTTDKSLKTSGGDPILLLDQLILRVTE